MSLKRIFKMMFSFAVQANDSEKNDKQKLHNLSLKKLTLLSVLLPIFCFFLFCATRLEPHYLSSYEAFIGNFYRGKLISFIHDGEKAKKYLAQAVEKDNAVEPQCDMGEVYAEEKNYKLAAYYEFTAAIHGSQRCEVHFLKLDFHDEESKVFQMVKKLADEKKYASAQFMVGKRLVEGVGVSREPKKGISYLEAAVAQNHWGASLYLAGIYIKGELVPKDIDKANSLMENKKL